MRGGAEGGEIKNGVVGTSYTVQGKVREVGKRGQFAGEVPKHVRPRKGKRHQADRTPNFLRRSEKVMTVLNPRAYARTLIQKIKHIYRQAPPHYHSKEKNRNNKNASDRPLNAFLKSVSKRRLAVRKKQKAIFCIIQGRRYIK